MTGLPELAPKPSDLSGTVPDIVRLRHTIFDVVRSECVRTYKDKLKALVATGSFARDEGSVTRAGESWTIHGDAEFLAVFDEHARVPAAEDLVIIRRIIERELSRLKISCKIDLSPVSPAYFRSLPAHIFSYELKHCGQVIAGDESILKSIPDYPADKISREDAWRLLCNRLIELLEYAEQPCADSGLPPESQQYRLVKLVLDMATSLLIFERAYAPSYRERRDAMARLASQNAQLRGLPLDLEVFARLVAECTALKLQPQMLRTPQPDLTQQSVLQSAHALWRWELAQLTGTDFQTNDRDLFDHWVKLQPWWKNLRGWLYVLRACGWQHSYRMWPRWWTLRKASPRHWIYVVTTSLLFQPAGRFATGTYSVDWKSLSRLLPVAKKTANRQPSLSWKDVAGDVVWNYQQFLTGTRA
jgi:hypothetical protein